MAETPLEWRLRILKPPLRLRGLERRLWALNCRLKKVYQWDYFLLVNANAIGGSQVNANSAAFQVAQKLATVRLAEDRSSGTNTT